MKWPLSSLKTTGRQFAGPARSRSALDGYILCALAGLALMLALQAALFAGAPQGAQVAALAVYGAAALVAGDGLRRSYPHPVLGLCNMVTLLRGALVATLVTPLLSGTDDGWTVAGLALVALILDGVDGRLARRARLVSGFGARFDVEVDSALALILSLLALTGAAAGPEVLLLGLMRYAYVAAALALPWLAHPLPERQSRKAVCVLQLATLIALQVPGAAAPVAALLLPLAALALVWSFGRDILWLWRTRA